MPDFFPSALIMKLFSEMSGKLGHLGAELPHVETAAHSGTLGADLKVGAVQGLDEMGASAPETVSGTAREKAGYLRAQRARHEFFDRMLRPALGIMLYRSMRNKIQVGVPVVAALHLMEYKALPDLVTGPALGLFAAYIAREASNEITTKKSASANMVPANSGVQNQMRDLIEKVEKIDLSASQRMSWVTAAFVYDLPPATQTEILVGLGAMTSVGLYGFIGGVLKLEMLAEDLRASAAAFDPLEQPGRLRVAQNYMRQVSGNALARTTNALHNNLPHVAPYIKFAAAGRIICHAFPKVDAVVEHLATASPSLTELPARVGLWLALGAACGGAAYGASKTQPLLQKASDKLHLREGFRAAKRMVARQTAPMRRLSRAIRPSNLPTQTPPPPPSSTPQG